MIIDNLAVHYCLLVREVFPDEVNATHGINVKQALPRNK
jgi:hypothetical protein